MPRRKDLRPARYYDPQLIVDAPEHHAFARAFGLLTSATWRSDVRSVDDRIREFVSAFPPDDPVRFLRSGPITRRGKRGAHGPDEQGRLQRFTADDGRTGSVYEVLARYGLKLKGSGPLPARPPFVPSAVRETAQRRNVKLRVLHGAVDIEPSNMDAAKAAYLDLEEKKKAAAEVREALRRVRDELSEGNGAARLGDPQTPPSPACSPPSKAS